MHQNTPQLISGFSKLDKLEKRTLICSTIDAATNNDRLESFDVTDTKVQSIMDNFSENTVANFPLPYGIAPNVLVNGQSYLVPMVTEESSVVAAASSAAKFWFPHGGFKAEVLATEKLGQLHFRWSGTAERRGSLLPELTQSLKKATAHLTERMEARGGGVLGFTWKHLPEVASDYYQLLVRFNTQDSMGANFINTILEAYGEQLQYWASSSTLLNDSEREIEVIMAILSNYTPNCIVRTWVTTDVAAMPLVANGMNNKDFCRRFELAVKIAREDPYRAVTHNKGIMNGIDAVVLATGNDFRAIEAGANAFAVKDGVYRSLSQCEVSNGQFHFELSVPLALGTVGGLTKLHPLANFSLDLLGRPSAKHLMQIIAATGLAQNFAAVRSLVTTGIQKGHMKMHLQNILQSLNASSSQKAAATDYFKEKTVSHHAVKTFLEATPD